MVEKSVDLLGLLPEQAADADLDFLREAVGVLAEALMDAEVSMQIGAGYGERTLARTVLGSSLPPPRQHAGAVSGETTPSWRWGTSVSTSVEHQMRTVTHTREGGRDCADHLCPPPVPCFNSRRSGSQR